MNKINLLILFSFISFSVFSQVNINANIGYASYQLYDLKEFQMNLLSSSPLNDKKLEQFPNYIYYSISEDIFLNDKNILGFGLDYYTTGARNHLQDYSGEYKLDMILTGYAFSGHYKNLFASHRKFHFYLKLKAGVIFSSLNIDESMQIYNVDSYQENYTFKSKTFLIEPSIFISYSIFKNLFLNICVGYEGNVNSKLFLEDNSIQYFEDDKDVMLSHNGKRVMLNWTGLRTSMGITIAIPKKTG